MVSMNDIFVLWLLFGCMFSFVTGCILGKYQERLQWNKLIDRGILPAPKKKKKVLFGCGY